MDKIRNSFAIVVLLLTGLIISSCGEKPEVIYKNAKIYTLNKNNDIVEALAIKDGKILEVGSSADLEKKYSADDVVDMKGAVIVPGFVDTEGAIIEFSKNLNYIDLSTARSLRDVRELLISRTQNAKGGDVIGGYGWSELNFTESELQKFDKDFLDNIASQYNVFLLNATMTTVWLNSRMLRTLGIDSMTKVPEGGEIQKFEDGEPTGLLFGEAVNIVRDNLPGTLRPDMLNLAERGAKEIVKYGITQVHDRTVTKEALSIFKELIDSNRFPLRVYAVISGEDSVLTNEFLASGIEKDYKGRLTVRAVSLDYDGSFDLQQAVIREPYKSDPISAVPYVTDNTLEDLYARASEKGFQFRVKAVGDKAVGNVLSIIDKAGNPSKISERRLMLEHCEIVSPSEIAKIGELKIIPSLRPDVSMISLAIAGDLTVPEAAKKIGMWGSLLKSAGMITSGSDLPFHQINPLIQIYYLVSRQPTDTLLQGTANMNEKISMLDAVKSYTVWPAYASFEENEKGTLEAGKFADFVVLSKDIFNEPPSSLLETKVLRTMIRGRIVYDNVFDPEKL